MRIQYTHWAEDGVGSHTVSFGLRQFVFLDTEQGILDVRRREDIEMFLRHPSHAYHLVYEALGVMFDAEGNEIAPVVVVTGNSATALASNIATGTVVVSKSHVLPTVVPKRGHPKKR